MRLEANQLARSRPAFWLNSSHRSGRAPGNH
jgi:hypothetical protein